MFLIDDSEYDPFSDLFSTFKRAIREDPRLTDIKDNGDVYVHPSSPQDIKRET